MVQSTALRVTLALASLPHEQNHFHVVLDLVFSREASVVWVVGGGWLGVFWLDWVATGEGGFGGLGEVMRGICLAWKGFLSLEKMPSGGAIVEEEAVVECTGESEIVMGFGGRCSLCRLVSVGRIGEGLPCRM
jgi:hypothetical protein